MSNCTLGHVLTTLQAMRTEGKGEEYKFLESLFSNPVLIGMLADHYSETRRQKDAVPLRLKLIELQPDNVFNYYHLACDYTVLGHLVEAEKYFVLSIKKDGRQLESRFHYGVLLFNQCRYDAALSMFYKALDADPLNALVLRNIAVTLSRMHRYEESLVTYRKSLHLNPKNYDACRDFSFELLRSEQYREGWEAHESRNIIKGLFEDRHVRGRLPKWEKGIDLKGKSLFLAKEQGFGDAIQFFRYLPYLKEIGVSRITYMTDVQVVSLFSSSVDDFITVIPHGETAEIPEHDYWAYHMTVPYILSCQGHSFGTRSIPRKTPYLTPSKHLVDKWSALLPAGLKVGVSWKGSPKHPNDSERSMELSKLSCLWDIKQPVSFISLQKFNPDPMEVLRLNDGQPIVNVLDSVNDFNETAAIISQLDIVISIDSAVAHLTGALNVPCFAFIPFNDTDWRWQITGDTSAWYPSMKLFRQSQIGDWDSAVKNVKTELEQCLLNC